MIPRHQVAVRPNPRLRPLLPWYPVFLIFFYLAFLIDVLATGLYSL
jgi:hypothetical protein